MLSSAHTPIRPCALMHACTQVDTIEDKTLAQLKAVAAGADLSKADGEALKKRKLVKPEWVQAGVLFRRARDDLVSLGSRPFSESASNSLPNPKPSSSSNPLRPTLSLLFPPSPSAWKTYCLTKGPKFALERVKPATDLTADMIQKGTWKTQEFKAYNFNALGTAPAGGHLHPLLKVRGRRRGCCPGMEGGNRRRGRGGLLLSPSLHPSIRLPTPPPCPSSSSSSSPGSSTGPHPVPQDLHADGL